MKAARQLSAALLLGIPLLCHICRAEDTLTPEQQERIETFHQMIPHLSQAMHQARAALQNARDTAGADAAAPAVAAVSQAEKQVSEAAAGLTAAGLGVTRLFRHGGLAKAITSLPIEAYNTELRTALAAGCHGSVALYLAITEDTRPYTAEQLQAELSEQERTDLAAVEKALAAVGPICPVSHWREKEDEFVRLFDASVPAAERLQQRPPGALLLHQLLEKYSKDLYDLANREFLHNGDLEERFLLSRQNYIAHWYSQRAFNDYFYRRADAHERNCTTPRGKAIWDAAAPRLAELRRRYDLGPGDGRTRETAFEIPAEIKREDFKRFVNEVTRELFGDRALYSNLSSSWPGTNGREVMHGLILVGRHDDPRRLHEGHIIMPCYFNIDRKETAK